MEIQVNLCTALVTSLYVAGIALIIGDMLGWLPHEVAPLGVLFALGANMLYFQRCYSRLKTREIEAFSMGMGSSMHRP